MAASFGAALAAQALGGGGSSAIGGGPSAGPSRAGGDSADSFNVGGGLSFGGGSSSPGDLVKWAVVGLSVLGVAAVVARSGRR